jgi:biopolymer transport protein ExbB
MMSNVLRHCRRSRVAVILLALLVPLGFAQVRLSRADQDTAGVGQSTDPGPQVAGELTPAGADRPFVYRNLFDLIRDGGVMMIPIFACSFIMMVFVFERFISLRRGRVIPKPFVKRLLHQLREGKIDREVALDLCLENQSVVAGVFAAGVKKWGRPAVEVEQAVLDAGERAASGLRRYLRLFNGVSTIGPLLGLLGTVFGMIRLFSEISTADAMGRTELLAGGISEALLTTAAGLTVAIPALCFYVYFLGRVDRLVMELDSLGQEVVGLVSAEALQEDRKRGSRRPTAAA